MKTLLLSFLILTGCANPPPFLLSHTTDKQGNEHYDVAPTAKVVTDTAKTFGPWGTVAGLLAYGALDGWAHYLNRRALKKHVREKHPK